DGAGFVGAMKAAKVEIIDACAHVTGAGGVSAGICCALAEAGIGHIFIANRSLERAEKLADRLRCAFPNSVFTTTDAPPDAEIDIVVNATSPALSTEDPPPVDLSATRRGIFVGDVVNVPRMTPLLHAAEARGCRTQHGKAMFG